MHNRFRLPPVKKLAEALSAATYKKSKPETKKVKQETKQKEIDLLEEEEKEKNEEKIMPFCTQVYQHLSTCAQQYPPQVTHARFIPIENICTEKNRLLHFAHIGPEMYEAAAALVAATRYECNMLFYVWDSGCDAVRNLGHGLQLAAAHFKPSAEIPKIIVRIAVRETQLAENSMLNELYKTKNLWNLDPNKVDLQLAVAPSLAFANLHSKYIVVDRQLVFVTGSNTESHFDRRPGHWNDVSIILFGPVANVVNQHFVTAWNKHSLQLSNCVSKGGSANPGQTAGAALSWKQRLLRLLVAPIAVKALTKVEQPLQIPPYPWWSLADQQPNLPRYAGQWQSICGQMSLYRNKTDSLLLSPMQQMLENCSGTNANKMKSRGAAKHGNDQNNGNNNQFSQMQFSTMVLSKAPQAWFDFKMDQMYRNDADQAILYCILHAVKELTIVTANINDRIAVATLNQALHQRRTDPITGKPEQPLHVQLLTNLDFNESAETDMFQPGGNFEAITKLVNHCPECIKAFQDGQLEVRWYSYDKMHPVDGNGANVNHSKALFVDNHTVLLGSQNLDQQSMQFSDETNILIENVPVTQHIKSVLFDQHWSNATQFCVPTLAMLQQMAHSKKLPPSNASANASAK